MDLERVLLKGGDVAMGYIGFSVNGLFDSSLSEEMEEI